jgi:hypothetical protein
MGGKPVEPRIRFVGPRLRRSEQSLQNPFQGGPISRLDAAGLGFRDDVFDPALADSLA